MSRSLNLLVVGQDSELESFEDALQSTKKYVGPIKLFSASKAVDAVGRLQKCVQQLGVCHAALMSYRFTLPGKEEFSDTLRKVLSEKYPDVPIVCWGNTKKGGEQGKHYHASLDFPKGEPDVNALVDLLKQVQAGQIKAEYKSKLDKRGSFAKAMDRGRSSSRSNSMGRSLSITGRNIGDEEAASTSRDAMRRRFPEVSSMERMDDKNASFINPGVQNQGNLNTTYINGAYGMQQQQQQQQQQPWYGAEGCRTSSMNNGNSFVYNSGSFGNNGLYGNGGMPVSPNGSQMMHNGNNMLVNAHSGNNAMFSQPASMGNSMGLSSPAGAGMFPGGGFGHNGAMSPTPAQQQQAAGSSNIQLLQMLTAEVSRLRQAVDDKRTRDALAKQSGAAHTPGGNGWMSPNSTPNVNGTMPGMAPMMMGKAGMTNGMPGNMAGGVPMGNGMGMGMGMGGNTHNFNNPVYMR